jgi:endoglucanase
MGNIIRMGAIAFWFLMTCTAGAASISGESFKDSNLRGFNLGSNTTLSSRDMWDMRRTGANVARYIISGHRIPGANTYAISPNSFSAVERLLKLGAEMGFKVVLALQPLPNDWDQEYWVNKDLQPGIVQLWEKLATRYRHESSLAGYDLINEPIARISTSRETAFTSDASKVWNDLALHIIDAVRLIDPDHAIIFEPSPGGLPMAFGYSGLPLPRNNIVYSLHMYEPHTLTHQGIDSPQSTVYPGESWDKAQMARSLRSPREFAARTGSPMFVGEFSVVRWAPQGSSINYLTDLLSIIDDDLKWSWAYHAWRECECWDAEIPSSFYHQFHYAKAKPQLPPNVQAATQREKKADAVMLLESYYAKNAE